MSDILKMAKPLDVKKLYQHGRDFESQLNKNNVLVKAASYNSPALRANDYDKAPTVSHALDPFLSRIFSEVVPATTTHWPHIILSPQILQDVAVGATITPDTDASWTGSDQALVPANKAYVKDFEYSDVQTLTFGNSEASNLAGLDAVVSIDLQNSDVRTGFQGSVGWVSGSRTLQAAGTVSSGTLTGSVDPLTTLAALESGSVQMSVRLKKERLAGRLDVIVGFGFYDSEVKRRQTDASGGGNQVIFDPDGVLRYNRMELIPHEYMPEKYIFFTPSDNLGIVVIEGANTSNKFYDARVGQGGTLQVTIHRRMAFGFRNPALLYLYTVDAIGL